MEKDWEGYNFVCSNTSFGGKDLERWDLKGLSLLNFLITKSNFLAYFTYILPFPFFPFSHKFLCKHSIKVFAHALFFSIILEC